MTQWVSGHVARKTQWSDTHFSLAIEADGPAFLAGQFIRIGMDLGDERVGRPYSLINPPHERLLEIFFNIVPEGPLSGELAALEIGDPVWLTAAANGLLTLSEVPQTTRDLWMLATGTGVGPFLSILQTDEPWERFDTVVLGYGVRYVCNLGYRELIDRLVERHPERFRFVPLVTGETLGGALQGRIPENLEQGRIEQRAGITLDPSRSHVMLCGHSGMIGDAVAELEKRGMKRHRRRDPGQISTEKYH
ncbi:MAG: ferredoxin--NADP reductase [Chromatiaceae bacterium]|nr:ferredoxin--NADP reductase [Gammaproteobacteria bacterium]MCP5300172.1 ferredoxin--NADP reductase [Chromatiaceae bacterium]MCP5422244.1 ferredoxin--NADP reductase [Chromatiaceae bacterium]